MLVSFGLFEAFYLQNKNKNDGNCKSLKQFAIFDKVSLNDSVSLKI